MNSLLNSYLKVRRIELLSKINDIVNTETLDEIADNIFRDQFLNERGLIRGHTYYLEITRQKTKIIRQHNFMHTFKKRYGLQYIDRACLDNFEANKKYILNNIVKRPFKIYNDFFASVRVIQNGQETRKKLTSFFTKLAHTISPDQFSALDNPIRAYFGIKNESFFVSYALLNETYTVWIRKNKRLMKQLRSKIESHDVNDTLKLDTLEDLKLLDMIFWFKANREQKR